MAPKRSSGSSSGSAGLGEETPSKAAKKGDGKARKADAIRVADEKDVPEPLTCPACECGMLGEILQCPTGHSFCKHCFQKLHREGSPCMMCQKLLPAEPARNFALELMAASISFPCKWEGCDFKDVPGKLQAHQRACKHRPYECVVAGCEARLPEKDLEKHLEDEHGFLYTRNLTLCATSERAFWSRMVWPTGLLCRARGALYVLSGPHTQDQVLRFIVYHFGRPGQAMMRIQKPGAGKVAMALPTMPADQAWAAWEVESQNPASQSSTFTFCEVQVARFARLEDGQYKLSLVADFDPGE